MMNVIVWNSENTTHIFFNRQAIHEHFIYLFYELGFTVVLFYKGHQTDQTQDKRETSKLNFMQNHN